MGCRFSITSVFDVSAHEPEVGDRERQEAVGGDRQREAFLSASTIEEHGEYFDMDTFMEIIGI